MIDTKTKSVSMRFDALFNYVLNTNYRNISGVVGIGISIFSLIFLIIKWGELTNAHKVAFAILALLFTVLNPLNLAFKTYKQLKLSPAYKTPLVYTFGDDGITVKQGEVEQLLPWKNICRIMMTGKILAIYTSRIHAFVIPLSELGDDKGKILAAVVQFTAEYKPQVSKSLREYQSGKGI